MKKFIFLLIIVWCNTKIKAQQAYWQQQVDFKINVTLNDVNNTLAAVADITYTNNSPDTLFYIWFHLWPNAYKNDRTAFSDQMLENGSTQFYFSEENKKGYINQLNFKVDNENAFTEDHPQHQDIIKLLLPTPLPPNKAVVISTPFLVKLPYHFSRSGHLNQQYQIAQWYPKPAVYDNKGWQPMPYLDQGEFYNNFGNYDVQITLPENYVVAATGELQNQSEVLWLNNKSLESIKIQTILSTKKKPKITTNNIKPIPSSPITKTIRYTQNNVHDFAWFASKNYIVKSQAIELPSKRLINTFAFYLPQNAAIWQNSMQHIKNAILTKSNWVGEYPYNVVSVVDNPVNIQSGMEYPTITLLSAIDNTELEELINHEVGHNWFCGILATNEREYPWMDEGMNTYYDLKYKQAFLNEKSKPSTNKFAKKFVTNDIDEQILQAFYNLKKDQPINTVSQNFTQINYNQIAYTKAALWLQALELHIGTANFNAGMQAYFKQWKFKHPTPLDYKLIMEQASKTNLSTFFDALAAKGNIIQPETKRVKLTAILNLTETKKYHYISAMPIVGYNMYDKFMLGAAIHNFNIPGSKLQFVAAPLYAAGTNTFSGVGNVAYNFYPTKNDSKFIFSLGVAKFTADNFKDTIGANNALGFSKIVPSIKYQFANTYARSNLKKYIQLKTFFIKETDILFNKDVVTGKDYITYPLANRYLNQLEFGIENHRILYPYNGILQAEQGNGFIRLNFTGNYYFNYAKGGGLAVRFFVGKFMYTGDKSFTTQFATDRYHLNLTGANGREDYTYQNYFIGRNEFEGLGSQQLMNRDGFFKVRTNLLSNKIGKTDHWLSAVNMVTDIPKAINIFNALPVKLPVKIFVDIGTYAEAWQKGSTTGRFLYDAGLQLSLFKNIINIYVPILYSKVYADYFKSTITEKRFQKNISFNVNIKQISASKLFPFLGL